MSNKIVAWWVVGVFVLAGSAASAVTVTENFDTGASAAVNGWSSRNNGVDSQVLSFFNTAVAGGTAGEARGQFTRNAQTQSYFADVSLGGVVPTASAFSSSGKFDVAASSTPDFGNGAYLGYFNPSDQSRFGIIFNDSGSNATWGLRIVLPGGALLTGVGLDAGHVISNNTDRTYSLNWDPSIGSGQLTGSISGAGASQVINLTAGQRTALDAAGFSLNAFGFNKGAAVAPNPARLADFRIDDATYTVAALSAPTNIGFSTEPFNDSISAGNNGWTSNAAATSNGNNFGFSNSNNTGGTPQGEAGGVFARGATLGYYADTTLGGSFDRADRFAASGEFDFTAISPTHNAGFGISFFDSTGTTSGAGGNFDRVGVTFAEQSGTSLRAFALVHFSDGTVLTGNTLTLLGLNMDRDFVFDFDPTGGVNGLGQVEVTIGGPGGGTSLIDFTVAQNGKDFSLDAFGLFAQDHGTTVLGNNASAFIDNVTYSTFVAAVPEPSSIAVWLVALCLGGAWVAKKRRQRI